MTNHPVSEWSPEQRRACEAVGGEIVDIPFPHVAPESEAAEVADLGTHLAEQVAGLGAAAALVQGEFTLVWVLVRELRARGVRCYSATTSRQAEVTPGGDGASIKTSVYRFVRLREYPD